MSIYQVIEFHENWHIEIYTYVHKWILSTLFTFIVQYG